MFNSSSTNRNLSFPPPPHPFLGHEGHQDIFSFCQYYNNTDLLVSDLSSANFTNFDSISSPPLPPVAPPPPPPLVVQNKTTTTMSATRTTKGQDCEENLGFPKKKKQGKTDRHSKICTAQGPRDRRVRLSIGIARKFFDLQDMLGFDKASKTIDWLLSKSKEAIDELNDECCNFEDDDDEEEEEEEKLKKAADSSSCSTKESRAKARARARERTIEKLSSKDSDLKKPTNCGQNWEIPGTSSRSSYRDITDMNVSPPDFQLSGKSWEVYSYSNQN